MIINLGKYQLKMYISKEEKRNGICSRSFLDPDKHMLLWDFDNAKLKDITDGLLYTQVIFELPEILVIESSPENYHAYCFASRSFREVIHILSYMREVDTTFLRLGIIRGYFTLRISTRNGENFKRVVTLPSNKPNEIDPLDLTVNEYLTSNKGGH